MSLSKAKLPKEVRNYIACVRGFVARLDAEMKTPSSFERGQRIGKLTTDLEIATDILEHFGIKERRTALPKPEGAALRPALEVALAKARLEEADWWNENGSDREGDITDAGYARLCELNATLDKIVREVGQ